jgi:hypothetical protein
MRSDRSSLLFLTAGLTVGLVVGVTAWSAQLARSRQALFHSRPTRRMAAISYLRARPSVDSVRLLRDYVAWESHPLLRRRGQRALRRVERALP